MTLIDSMNARRSIRRYTAEPVADGQLARLLETAARGSTCGNMQLYSVVKTTSPEGKRALAPLHMGQPMVEGAPLLLTFCVDYRRFTLWCEQRRATPGYDNLLSFLNAAVDTMVLTERFATAAEAEGLGICYLGTTLYSAGQIIEQLRLPRLVFPLTTLSVGHPDEQPPQCERLTVDSFLHEEHYHDYAPADIDRCYLPKEALPENRHFVDINHKETLAQVFTDLRYTRADCEAISSDLLALLRRQGFLPQE